MTTADVSLRRDVSPQGAPWYFWLIAGMLSIVVLVPVWRCHYFPSQNGPQILSLAFIEKELDNPAYGFSEYYEHHGFPIPNLLQQTVEGWLLVLFDPVVVDKLMVSLLVLLRPWATIYFLRGLAPGQEIYGLVSFAFAYDFPLMHVYYNFYAGVAIGLVVFGYYLRHREGWRFRSLVLFNLLVLLLYFAHAWAFAITGLSLALYEFAATCSPKRIVGIVVRGFVPGLVLLLSYLYWTSQVNRFFHWEKAFQTITDKFWSLQFRCATPLSQFANTASLILLATIGVVGVLALLRKHGRWRFERIDVDPALLAKEPMLLVVPVLFVLYLLAPWSFLGWHHLDMRFLIMAVALTPAIPPVLRHPWMRGVVIAGIAALVLAGLPSIADRMRSLSDDLVEYTAGIDSVPRRSKILPLFCNQPTFDMDKCALHEVNRPIKGGNAYYVMARGGATERGFATNNTLYQIWYKGLLTEPGPNYPSVDADQPTPEQLDAAASAYDAVLIWNGAGRLRGLFADRGFSKAFQNARLTIMTKSTDGRPAVSTD